MDDTLQLQHGNPHLPKDSTLVGKAENAPTIRLEEVKSSVLEPTNKSEEDVGNAGSSVGGTFSELGGVFLSV